MVGRDVYHDWQGWLPRLAIIAGRGGYHRLSKVKTVIVTETMVVRTDHHSWH